MTAMQQLTAFQDAVEKHYRPMHARVMRSCEFRATKGPTLKVALAQIMKEAVVLAKTEMAAA